MVLHIDMHMDQENREYISKLTCMETTDVWQRHNSNIVEKIEPFQQMVNNYQKYIPEVELVYIYCIAQENSKSTIGQNVKPNTIFFLGGNGRKSL